ncbi:TPA: hypothetical protein ACQ2HZ_005257 [Klebsiella pneumoniae]
MGNLTRTEVAKLIRNKLLNGGKLTPKQLDRILQKYGNHERSRVLELLRCKWGNTHYHRLERLLQHH